MDLKSTIRVAYIGLKTKKSRTFMTMLGIIIGIASVIIIISVGNGAQSLILNQVKGMGSNLIGIFPGASEEAGPPPSALGIVNTTLKNADLDAIMKNNNVPNAIAVTYYDRGVGTFQWREKKYDGTFVGTTVSYTKVHDIKIAKGRFFNGDEEKDLARVVVLGADVAKELFGDDDPVGKNIKIKKEEFKVIGVVEKRGTQLFENQDALSFIPISTAQKIMLGVNYVSLARVQIDAEENTDQAVADIRALLRDRHKLGKNEPDDFSIRPQTQAIEIFSAITDSLTYFLAAIAAISLLVGGIGIMNIMLIAVVERTREVGLRKALGAKNKNILSQFLAEAIVVTLSGGIAGVIFGILISLLVAIVARQLGYEWDLIISYKAILLSCSISILIGLIFGIYPARRAAKLNPIEALRYE
ncbi:ABC transporter permease [Candidatus Falkowbacteria bacterium]|nr:ABC transporter permease [Candidatus Falkowbacteria bacterium]